MRRIVVFAQNPGKPRSVSRAGFTLIELLVVISIIATLMSLILPAIQNAREAGRRTQCLNNIRNVTVACMNFASSSPKSHLPALSYYPEGVGTTLVPPFIEGRSWVVEILPYMDQQGTYDRWDKTAAWNSTVLNASGSSNLSLASDLFIEALTCPNDESAFQVTGGLTYVANGGFASSTLAAAAVGQTRGHTFFDSDFDWNSSGTTKDVEDKEITFKTGVFWANFSNGPGLKSICNNRCTSVGKIYDGSSNTLLLAENINAGIVNWANPALNSCGFVFPLNGGSAAAGDTTKASNVALANTPAAVKTGTTPFINQKKSGPEGAPFPNSNHPGIVVVSMCDGSARSLSEGLDKYVYTKLITPDGSRLRSVGLGSTPAAFTAETPVSGSDF